MHPFSLSSNAPMAKDDFFKIGGDHFAINSKLSNSLRASHISQSLTTFAIIEEDHEPATRNRSNQFHYEWTPSPRQALLIPIHQ
jgi:hypothetical protein